MQTFLPYKSFTESAKCLDMKRLGKQRVETWQIYQTIKGISKGNGWRNHPAVLMWKDNPYELLKYGIAICEEWIRRGYKDTMLQRFNDAILIEPEYQTLNGFKVYHLPEFLGDEEFHSSHRQTLLFKNQPHYSNFGWTETPKYEYKWPVMVNKK